MIDKRENFRGIKSIECSDQMKLFQIRTAIVLALTFSFCTQTALCEKPVNETSASIDIPKKIAIVSRVSILLDVALEGGHHGSDTGSSGTSCCHVPIHNNTEWIS